MKSAPPMNDGIPHFFTGKELTPNPHVCLVFIGIMLVLLSFSSSVLPQETRVEITASEEASRLDKLVDVLQKRLLERQNLQKLLAGDPTDRDAIILQIEAVTEDIKSLTNTFESLTIGDIDDSIFENDNDVPFNWQSELMLILEPVFDSLKSLTEKPRQMAELRSSIELYESQLTAANNAISSLQAINLPVYEKDTQSQIYQLQEKWVDQKDSIEQRLLSAGEQLERLKRIQETTYSGVLPGVRQFILGRGLTLAMAMAAAIASWVAMRALWWFFSTHIVSKSQRRGSLWFRLFSYSFYIINIVVCIIAILAVLYAREDLLLLSLLLLLLAFTALGIRRYVPSYIREARLLLNLGAVREGERVFYNDLPWQVNSINIQSVLWNPALEGIVRLPLETIETLVSRPIKDKNWFPTNKGDFVILPDNTFGQVVSQTPELLQLRVRGGMLQSFKSSDFYGMNIINLSAGDTFGVSTTFGFDYSLQAICLTDIPTALESSMVEALEQQGYSKHLDSVLVELQNASSSSLDYLVFITVNGEKASDYFKLERLIQQVCVDVANKQGWNIPFPQMMVHHQAVNQDTPQTTP